ncbi:hypothetical protein H6P81_020274 [Aristolochia fimbriata]|uniref:Reticulon-like protein n=1 Tax=Aristolochia fimbriata TaxID=158543 RepID=A0AAV7DVV2_ARIFI|nr:hypothetical protein H6P81_020274 [Aristolochia fimbriata]
MATITGSVSGAVAIQRMWTDPAVFPTSITWFHRMLIIHPGAVIFLFMDFILWIAATTLAISQGSQIARNITTNELANRGRYWSGVSGFNNAIFSYEKLLKNFQKLSADLQYSDFHVSVEKITSWIGYFVLPFLVRQNWSMLEGDNTAPTLLILFLWRNKQISAAILVVATVLWLLFEWLGYHLLTFVCHALIVSLGVLFCWSNVSCAINRFCEICGEAATNITDLGDQRFMEDWNERRILGRETNSSSYERGRCWRGQPFCNFLMACLVIAFILPWFFRINMF